MKIALLGYGKMGKTIEQIAQNRGHEIVGIKDSLQNDFNMLANADVAIDFSIPSAAVENISNCFEHNIPVISGTTGWLAYYDDMVKLCQETNGTFLYGSNFSLGVNIFFEVNKHLSKLMAQHSQYHVAIEEIHHTQKLDAPSGTAITLAEQIIEETSLTHWELDSASLEAVPIKALRIEKVPGTHTVSYTSDIDTIEIKHTAHSREGFALGAVIAAEWIVGKKGIFTMKDVLGL